MPSQTSFDLKFTSREVTAWGGLALLKRLIDGMGLRTALQSWQLPQPGSNRGYRPEQLFNRDCSLGIWRYRGELHGLACIGPQTLKPGPSFSRHRQAKRLRGVLCVVVPHGPHGQDLMVQS